MIQSGGKYRPAGRNGKVDPRSPSLVGCFQGTPHPDRPLAGHQSHIPRNAQLQAIPGYFRLATADLRRRPLRTALAVLGVALSTSLLLGTVSLHAGYVRALDSTIER